MRIDSLHFAADTPYDTQLSINPELGKRVLPSEVAAAMREALSQVVDGGTAKRVQGTFKMQDGSVLAMGGKTGTGDNRIESVGAGGRILSSRAINRTATFCVLYRRQPLWRTDGVRAGTRCRRLSFYLGVAGAGA